jgi:RNA polymerase sigma-70 factor (ECF subfamily)
MSCEDRFTKHGPRLLAFAKALSGDGSVAEDLVQECYLKAMRADQAPLEEKARVSWLFKILRNSFIDHLRRQRRLETFFSQEELDESQVDGYDMWAAADRAIDAITVRQAFEQLSGPQREILWLIDLSGFSYSEAAGILDVPIGTVMSRVSRARSAMAAALAESNIVPVGRRQRQGR